MRRLPLILTLLSVAVAAQAQDVRLASRDIPASLAADELPANARIVAPPVKPGAIVTTPLRFVRPPHATAGTYVVLPSSGVRVFGETYGRIESAAGDTVLLPLTYSIPRTRPAGRTSLARVVVQWNDGTSWIVDVEADVVARRALRVVLAAETGVAYRGRSTMLRLAITNLGNAPDTVSLKWNAGGDWQLSDAPLLVVVPPGETLVRPVTLRCPALAVPGEVHIVQVTAIADGASLSASAAVRVGYRPSSSPELVEAPSTVFVGSTIDETGEARHSMALTSAGDLTSDTHFSLVARRRESSLSDPVLAQELAGQTFRLDVRRKALRAAVGDVWRSGSALTGVIAQGRGADLSWRDPRFDASVLVARPTYGGARGVGHADAGVITDAGRFGASLMYLERAGAMPGDSSTLQSAGLTYAHGERGRRYAGVELGAVRLTTADRGTMLGLGFDGEFERSADVGGFAARLHLIPSSPATSSLMPTSGFVSANRLLTDRVRALGTASATRTRSDLGALSAEGASAGASVRLGDANVTMLGNLRHLSVDGDSTRSTSGRGASVALSLPIRALVLDGYAEHGLSLTPEARDRSDLVRGGVRWFGDAGWFWVGATYARNGGGAVTRSAEMNGAYRRGRAELQAGTNAQLAPQFLTIGNAGAAPPDALELSTFWSRLTVDVTRDLALVGGAAYQRSAFASPWRFSLGLRRRLSLPLPVRRAPVVRGTTFEDLNGNRQRDEGEPAVPGIGLALGMDRALTAPDGGYSFVDPALRGQTLSVDVASLPPEFLLPPDVHLGNTGRVDVPLVRGASVQLLLFVDANGNGVSDDEATLPDGVIATLDDGAGRRLDAPADAEGTVRFRSLIPGRYTLTVTTPPDGPRPGAVRTQELVVGPGAAIRIELALPSVRREIRFNDSRSR
jgi:hypothetical protein